MRRIVENLLKARKERGRVIGRNAGMVGRRLNQREYVQELRVGRVVSGTDRLTVSVVREPLGGIAIE
jgi:hypothetical protein